MDAIRQVRGIHDAFRELLTIPYKHDAERGDGYPMSLVSIGIGHTVC